MSTAIRLRRDTSVNWAANDPTLAEGEVGVETTSKQFKIGTGNTPWSTLPFATPKLTNPANGEGNYASASATTTALAGKAPSTSPIFNTSLSVVDPNTNDEFFVADLTAGVDYLKTILATDNGNQVANTRFVQAQKDSPTFTGTPTSTTQDNSAQGIEIATCGFVKSVLLKSFVLYIQTDLANVVSGGNMVYNSTDKKMYLSNGITYSAYNEAQRIFQLNGGKYYSIYGNSLYQEDVAFAPIDNPTFTGNVVVPNGDAANEAVNKGQLDLKASIISVFANTIETVSALPVYNVDWDGITLAVINSNGNVSVFFGDNTEGGFVDSNLGDGVYYGVNNSGEPNGYIIFATGNGNSLIAVGNNAPKNNPTFTGITSGIRKNVVTKGVNYTATANDDIIIVNDSITITLPPVADLSGKEYILKGYTAGFTVAASGTDDFADDATVTVLDGEALVVVGNGSHWFIVSKM